MEKIYLSVYDRDLNFLGIIDAYTSLRWRRKFFEAGEFEIVLSPTYNNLKLINRDNIIVRSDLSPNDEAGIIESWKIKDEGQKVTVTVYGNFLLSLLRRRIVKQRINYSGDYIGGFRQLLNNMTPFNKLRVEPSSIQSSNIEFQCTYKNVYDFHTKLSRASNIGGKILVNLESKKYRYVNYVGKDRTENQRENIRYEFSEENSNLTSAEYVSNYNEMITDVLVGGTGEDENRIIREVKTVASNAHDFDIREKFVDAKSESNNALTPEEYNAILDNIGKQALSNPAETFEATVNPAHYREFWDLGDIVNIKKESWNIANKQVITEVEEIIEDGKYEIIPVYGDPIPETFINE